MYIKKIVNTCNRPFSNLNFLEQQKFMVRGHIYQARSLIGSDDSGLSGEFII